MPYTTRDPPAAAARRGAGGGARAGRDPALRRGQGQPIFPAGIQPGSWHRHRHTRRRHADQHAHPRPRPRLDRSQLPHPRAGTRRALQDRPLFRRRWRFRLRRLGAHEPAQRGRSRLRRTRPGRKRLPARPRDQRQRARRRQAALRGGGHNESPYVHPDDYQKFNGVLRYSRGDDNNGYSITAMAYDGQWNSTDQIPQRTIDQGIISRFDALDPTDGGRAYRQSLSAHWAHQSDAGDTQAGAYFIRSNLNLYSNFTFFLEDPVNGDQFQQHDDRKVAGVDLSHTYYNTLWGTEMAHLFGFQQRTDWINVDLFHTAARDILSTTGEHSVREASSALYYENNAKWTETFRSILGVRGDYYDFNVSDHLDAANSADKTATILNPKLGLVFGPWDKTSYFFNMAGGYHSNDARGVTKAVDPATPLVRAKSAEVGLRSFAIPNLETQVAVFMLDLASVLGFIGDAGTTEASGATRRWPR